jgi:multidrug resistance efflux pump
MKKKRWIAIVVLMLLLAGGGFWLYSYLLDSVNYFTTDNASVSANMVVITPLVTGNVQSWDVKEGDAVKSGQILGRQDLGTLVQSSAVNAASLSASADSLVNKADIKTPIDGKVVQSNVVQGETISPGMQVAVVADTNNMYIKANIEETAIFRIKEGQKVSISIDAYPGRTFTGFVESVGQATQSAFSLMPSLNTSGTYTKTTQLIPVKINLVNNDNLPLMLGMNATVKIQVDFVDNIESLIAKWRY